MSAWIEFRLSEVQAPKTARWDVITKGGEKEVGGLILGRIGWYGEWRRYAFFPATSTLYEPTCLRDIATFLDERMALKRAEAKRRRK